MDKLLSIVNAVAEQPPWPPPQPVAEENCDQDLFKEFMQQIQVWSYANRIQKNFSSFGEDEKRAIIWQCFSDMKTRRSFSGDKQHDILFLFHIRTKLR